MEQTVPEWLEKDARWQAVEKIANSEGFRRSVRLREFLLYITAQHLSGHAEEITEQNIGHRIYHRRESYSPADDNIVRVSARQLRLKLKEYYQAEGKDCEWIVEVPKGGYVPVIRKRQPKTVTQPIAQNLPARSFHLNYWVITVFISLAAGAIGWLIPHQGRPAKQTPPPNLITMIFGQSRNPVQVIVSDPVLSISRSIVDQKTSLTNYPGNGYKDLPAQIAHNLEAKQLWQAVTGRQLVNIGDVQATTRFRTALGKTSVAPPVVMRSAANMYARDFRSGNFILMGAADSDPWVQLFGDDHLSFRFVGGETDAQLKVVATDSNSGKLTSYIPRDDSGYARIALVPNLTETGSVLLIAGTSMESTESAANFCLDSASSEKLMADLGSSKTGTVPFFEALLQTNKASGTGLNAKIIAVRKLNPGTG